MDIRESPSVFGRVRLGYLLAESNRHDEWRRFGAEGLGVHVDAPADGTTVFRIDDRERRVIVRPGPAEDVIALGLEIDEGALETVRRRLAACGIDMIEGTAEEARLRGVERFTRILGPKGQWLELFGQPRTTHAPLSMKASGFCTGDGGLGHLAITTREPEAMRAFWQDIFDARVSDTIDDKLDGIQMDFLFLHMNERHHTVALAWTRGAHMDPLRTKIHHLNLQAASLDDVMAAYTRCRKLGYPITNAIGQHPNDLELSFYVATPSGFEIEIGWRPIVVPADKPWTVGHYTGISVWGHFRESDTFGQKLGRMRRGIASRFGREHVVDTAPARALKG